MTQSDPQQILDLSIVPEQDWPSVCQQFDDLSYEQTLTYSKAAANRIGATNEYLAMRNTKGQLVAAICLRIKTLPFLGKGIAWAPAGPLTCIGGPPTSKQLGSVLASLSSHAERSGHILRVRLPVVAHHNVAETASIAGSLRYIETPNAQSYRSVLIDCTLDEEMLMSGLHGKWRNPLRNALKSDLELEVVPLSRGKLRFEKMYQEVQSAKGFQTDIPPNFYYDLHGPDFEHNVLIARLNGQDVAGMTIGTANRSSVYLFGATTAQGRKLNAGHYLMWQAILYSKQKDVSWFDLGGIDPNTNPSVTRFKHRTGGIDVTAPGPFEYKPAKMSSAIIELAEALHTRLKRKK